MIIRSVPPGGNWRNIPETVPSKRLEQIRKSFSEGKGSRSTYYGRLRPEAPAYTINTYFTRPGNGCHIHYDFVGGQHRTLSQREAARLQTFPDNFSFHGSKTAINNQIGNAVPPILAYQIAKAFPFRGQFIDLFSGAGGLALGFVLAGWKPIIANDIDKNALETYRANIHENIICGDIREEVVFQSIIDAAQKAKCEEPSLPLFVLGGPPCQGFSTAGKKRSMEDERNWLFKQYKSVLETIRPEGFVFENVLGLLSMEQGKVFDMIYEELRTTANQLSVSKVNAVEYGVPQRRKRVVLIGNCKGDIHYTCPSPNEIQTISVKEALSDLPPLEPGEDGSFKNYLTPPTNPYQRFMRGEIDIESYLQRVEESLISI